MGRRISVDWDVYDGRYFSREILGDRDRFPNKFADFRGASDIRFAVLSLIQIHPDDYRRRMRNRQTPLPLVAYQDTKSRAWYVGQPEEIGYISPDGSPRDRPAIAIPVPHEGIRHACIGYLARDGKPVMLPTSGLDGRGRQQWSERRGGAVDQSLQSPLPERTIQGLGRKVSHLVFAMNIPTT